MLDFKKLALLAIEANGVNGFVVNCNFAGHVDAISVRIAESKDNYNNIVYNSELIWGTKQKSYDKTVSILERMIAGEEVFKPINQVIVPEHKETKWELAL